MHDKLITLFWLFLSKFQNLWACFWGRVGVRLVNYRFIILSLLLMLVLRKFCWCGDSCWAFFFIGFLFNFIYFKWVFFFFGKFIIFINLVWHPCFLYLTVMFIWAGFLFLLLRSSGFWFFKQNFQVILQFTLKGC